MATAAITSQQWQCCWIGAEGVCGCISLLNLNSYSIPCGCCALCAASAFVCMPQHPHGLMPCAMLQLQAESVFWTRYATFLFSVHVQAEGGGNRLCACGAQAPVLGVLRALCAPSPYQRRTCLAWHLPSPTFTLSLPHITLHAHS
jgi:hypothetical protein